MRSKAEFFALWRLGVLGNRPHLFDTPEEAYNSGYPFIGFREQGRAGGGAWCRVHRTLVSVTARVWTLAGRTHFIMDSGTFPACDDDITLQGEVCRTFRGWEGSLGVTPGYTMRAAMSRGLLTPRSSVETKVLVDSYMDPSSRDDLDQLLDLHPDATIEFTCFNRDVGVFPGRNTIFWECRCY